MTPEQTIKKSKNDTNQVIIHAENLGVSYITGDRTDDYKSRMYDYIFRRNKGQERNNLFWPLRNINFTGYKGEILGIIGSNGSGKTTLCKLISGILRPDEGRIQVNGSVSALFSLGLGFNMELTGRENVYMNGIMLGISVKRISQFIDEIHEFSGLGSFIDQPVKFYSSGMKARLGFSVSVFMEPEVLVLDEALNTGDMEFSQKAADKMKELVNKAKMVVLVTHSIGYAQKNCDRLIWIEKGVIKADGRPEEVAEKYRDSMPEKKQKKKMKLDIQKTDTLHVREKVVIKAENISISYRMKKGTFWALKDVNFQIKEGEVVGIIGHNGAGKSTLCKVLTNILPPDVGKLTLNGETTALLSYGTGFNSQLSGKDNIYLNGMLLGISKKRIEQHYPQIVSFSGLEKFINKPVKQYSSGMKARLGFSIAASLQPDIFIIDEALSTGDMSFNQKATEKIQDMISSAKAVIIVSHSMGFVEKVCTRAIWLEKGEIQYDGEPSEVVKLYTMKVKEKKAELKISS